MKKPKKITIKPFLNEALEPVEEIIDSSGECPVKEFRYPLYYMVIFNRNNTRFKSRLGSYYSTFSKVPLSIIDFETNTIRKILQCQISERGEDIDLKGLGNAVNLLSGSLFQCIEKYLKNKLKALVDKADSSFTSMINFDDEQNSFSRYDQLISTVLEKISIYMTEDFVAEIEAYNVYSKFYGKQAKLYPNFKAPIIIDWLNGEYNSIIEHEMKNEKGLKNVISLIDNAVKFSTQ